LLRYCGVLGMWEYQRDERRVHPCASRLIWCPRRRKRILVGQVAEDCARLIRRACSDQGWQVLELAVQPDHVHLLVQVFPAASAADVARECNGFTVHELGAKHPARKTALPSLWTRSYFISTMGDVLH